MRSACGPQPASASGAAPKSRGGRRSVYWTNRAWGQAAAYAGSTAAQQAAKWGARGSVRPPAVACWRLSTGPAGAGGPLPDRQPDSSASSTIDDRNAPWPRTPSRRLTGCAAPFEGTMADVAPRRIPSLTAKASLLPLKLVSKAPGVGGNSGDSVPPSRRRGPPVHGDAPAVVVTTAPQESGVGQPATDQVQLDHEGIGARPRIGRYSARAAAECPVESAWCCREVGGPGLARHIGAAQSSTAMPRP